MWYVATKKELREEVFNLEQSIKINTEVIRLLKEELIKLQLKVAEQEGKVTTLINRPTTPNPVLVSSSPRQTQTKFEERAMNIFRQNKPNIVKEEIRKLLPMDSLAMFNIIVKEKGLCSKATFYKHLAEIKKEESTKKEQEKELDL